MDDENSQHNIRISKKYVFIGDIHNYVKKIVFKYKHKLIPIQVPAMNWVYLY